MSHHDSRLNDAAKGNDLALADAISLITGDIAAVADLITTGHEDAADNTVPTSAILIGQLARELGDAAIAWADTKRDQAKVLAQDAKTAQVAARVAEILEGQRKDDAKAQATAGDDTTDAGGPDPAQVTEDSATLTKRDDKVVRNLRALDMCIMRLSSVFGAVIPIVRDDKVSDDPDYVMMLLEKGEECADIAFQLACDVRETPFGIDISLTEAEQEARDAGAVHVSVEAFDTVRAEFLGMAHTPRKEHDEA